jgi:hypothetical protein
MSQGQSEDDGTAAEDSDNPLFECEKCGGKFPAQEVYDSAGKIICKACRAKATASAVKATEQPAVTATTGPKPPARRLQLGPLLPRITCPHCWHRFPPDQILWESQHAELLGDTILGPEAASRFLPTRFAVDGSALDARGMQCQNLACPRCHLVS